MSRFLVLAALAGLSLASVAPARAQATDRAAPSAAPVAGPSVAEQALGAEVMECVRSRVALRAEIIGLKAAEAPAPAAPVATPGRPLRGQSAPGGPPVPPADAGGAP